MTGKSYALVVLIIVLLVISMDVFPAVVLINAVLLEGTDSPMIIIAITVRHLTKRDALFAQIPVKIAAPLIVTLMAYYFVLNALITVKHVTLLVVSHVKAQTRPVVLVFGHSRILSVSCAPAIVLLVMHTVVSLVMAVTPLVVLGLRAITALDASLVTLLVTPAMLVAVSPVLLLLAVLIESTRLTLFVFRVLETAQPVMLLAVSPALTLILLGVLLGPIVTGSA